MVADEGIVSFILTLGAGVIGGLILNIMPCVLPGLFMKARHVISQLQSGQSLAHRRAEGIMYLLGSLFTFTAYGILVNTLKFSSESLGWGMQMQNPLFVGILLVITFLFGLSSFDLINVELGVQYSSLGRSARLRSFLDGVFITLISTPCSAPVLGGAVTVALAQDSSWLETLLLFWSISIGLCLPILLISFIPAASKFVPQHGAWMKQFKYFVGVTLVAACVWLYTIYEKLLPNPDQPPRLLYALCIIAALLVLAPIWRESSKLKGRVLNVLMLASMGSALFWSSKAPVEYLAWQPYEKALVDQHLERGGSVFVDFTADWCLSCKAFEGIYLNTPATAELLRQHKVLPLKADLTNPKSPLWALLKTYNRTGIPAYLIYRPNKEPEMLPEGPPLTLEERIKAPQ